jgi:hypothetical protein
LPSASVLFVSSTIRVHRIPPRVRDDREPPLMWDETAVICEVIWVWREEEIFSEMGLDTKSVICPSGAISLSLREAAIAAKKGGLLRHYVARMSGAIA